MLFVYRVPAHLPTTVRAALERDGVRPGDDVVVEDGQRPNLVRPMEVDVTPHLRYLRLVSVEPDEMPATPSPPRLHLV